MNSIGAAWLRLRGQKMDRETVIALAQEAAFHTPVMEGELLRFAALIEEHLKDQGYRQCAKGQRTTQFCGMVEQAVQAEREARAQIAKQWDADHPSTNYGGCIAAAIRGRNV